MVTLFWYDIDTIFLNLKVRSAFGHFSVFYLDNPSSGHVKEGNIGSLACGQSSPWVIVTSVHWFPASQTATCVFPHHSPKTSTSQHAGNKSGSLSKHLPGVFWWLRPGVFTEDVLGE